MLKELESTEQFMAEIEVLRRKIAELRGIEQRCRQAEAALKSLEERNRLLGDSSPLGILTFNTQGRITGITRKMLKMLSWPPVDDPKSMRLSDCQTMVSSDVFTDIQRCIDQKKAIIVEHPYTAPQGDVAYLRYYLSPLTGADGSVSEIMVMVEDYTNLKRTEKALRESEMRYRLLFQSAPIALVERDASQLKAHLEQLRASGISDFRKYLERNPSQVQHCWSLIKSGDYNPAYLELMDLTNSDEPSGPLLPTDSKAFWEMALEIILVIAEGRNANERELTLVTATGESKFVLGKSLVVSGHEKTMERMVVALVDLSPRIKAEKTLRQSEHRFRNEALRDNLTGLFNQRYLYQSLAELIEGAQINGTQISMIFLDLDHFKQIVDAHGHLNGSRAIRQVALTIDNCLAKPAYAVAFAGDEFVVVLPGMDQSQALQKAAEIRSRIKDTVYVLEEDIEVRLQASFGIATWPQDAKELNGLIAAADQALFTIKDAGKDAIGQFQRQEWNQS
ncbi:MAG: diguanylate cyclase [Pseudomonadota bacterium]